MKRVRGAGACCHPFLLACLAAFPAFGQEETPFTRLFDTGAASAGPLAAEAVVRRVGWALVPEDKTNHQFSGDAVMLNDKLAVVLRQQGRGAEIYSKASGGLKHRATMTHFWLGSSQADPRGRLRIIENGSGAVMVEEANNVTARGSVLRFRVTTGEGLLEVRPGEGAGIVQVDLETRYVVVPDYFGDDMVFETGAPGSSSSPAAKEGLPERLLRGNLYLPAENFCLNLLNGGDAMVMSVWQSSEQEVRLTRSPEWRTANGERRTASSQQEVGLSPPPAVQSAKPSSAVESDVAGGPGVKASDLSSHQIRCLKGKSIWLAFLESPGLWHLNHGTPGGQWKPPFPAKWRCSLLRENGLADSWTTEKPNGFRPEESADSTPLSPGQSMVKTTETLLANAPLLLYPIDRSPATPLTASCPTDVMRNTLGVGPCQYILACEGLAAQGDPTPASVMGWVEKQFEQKKQKKAADDIKERLDVMSEHVAHARTRIQRYAQFADRVRKRLPTQPGAEAFRLMVADLDRFVAAGLGPNASPERARQLAGQVTALIAKADALAECQALGGQLRSLGAAQDSSLAQCRMTVRRVRAQGRTLAASPSPESALALQMQELAEEMLKEK